MPITRLASATAAGMGRDLSSWRAAVILPTFCVSGEPDPELERSLATPALVVEVAAARGSLL